MSADWLGVGALETPLGNLAFLLSARGIAAVRLGYPDWETAVDAVMPVRMADPRRMEGLSGGIDAVRYTVGSLIWIGAGGNPEPPGVARRSAAEFARYFRGEAVDFAGFPLDFGRATSFQLEVWRTCRSIPFGETVSYGRLAARMGRRSAARAVGRALAANPIPLIVPCHRVVAADGSLCGYSGYGGPDTKRKLLELERTAVKKSVFSPR